MKTQLQQKLFLCLLILFSLNFYSYSQDFIVNDDFESDVLGTLPEGWVIRYGGTGNANQKIVDDPVKNGIHSFQVSGSGWAANLSKGVTSMPNKVSLEVWMRAENVVSGGRSGLAIGNPSIGTWGSFIARIEFYNGNLITYYHTGNSGGYGTQYILQAATSNTWYHVKIEADFEKGTYKTYINGEQASSETGGSTTSDFPLLPSITPTSVEIYGNSMIYFDDIKLYETKKPIAYYPFNGNANDESGNNLHGTVSGATLTTDRFGNPDSAYNFNGSDVITIANDNLLNFENEVSFSVWIKPDSQQNAMVLGKSNYSTATNYVLRTQANNFIEYAHKTRNFSNNNPLNIGQWNHIAVISHSTSEREIYVNNQLTTFTSQPDSYGLVSNLISIGAAYHFGSYYAEFFNGSIDDIRIYNMALSASDVSSLYTNNSLGIKKNTLAQNNNFYVFNKCIYFNENQNLSEINSITIYNLLAQKIYESTEIQKENPIKFLKQGVYILKVEHKNNLIITKKFVMR